MVVVEKAASKIQSTVTSLSLFETNKLNQATNIPKTKTVAFASRLEEPGNGLYPGISTVQTYELQTGVIGLVFARKIASAPLVEISC